MSKRVKESTTQFVTKIFVLAIMTFFAWFFLGEVYNLGMFSRLFIALAAGISFFYQWKKSFFHFFLFALTSVFVFISIEISFNFIALVPFVASAICAFGIIHVYDKKKSDTTFAWLLLTVFLITWVILAFNVIYRYDWYIENILNVPFVILILICSRWFRFSKLSYSLMFIFMMLNVIGSHYTYAEVPFGFWLQEFFQLDRNHYDRIVHFSFGLLFAYPMREIFMRIGKAKGFWALWMPIELVLGLSAIYEVLEWWVAVVFGGDLGVAYLGLQGDVWDAQKDMFLAGVGSLIAMLVVFVVLISYEGREYIKELKTSLRVNQPEPLGERALEKIQRRK